MKKDSIALFTLIIGIFIFNYSFFDGLLISAFDDYEYGVVERIIDGDTIVINGTSIRLLGINSPERGETGYNEAKEFLESQILEQEVRIEFGTEKIDKYKRKLGYIFLKNKNINLASVENGFSSFYFLKGKTKYYSDFFQAWKNCLKKNIGLCENSKNICIKLESWNYKNKEVILKNICPSSIDLTNWSIKGEGRKKIILDKKEIAPFDRIIIINSEFTWTKTGDSLFIRDNNHKLVVFENY